jgi:hypothetical protein
MFHILGVDRGMVQFIVLKIKTLQTCNKAFVER